MTEERSAVSPQLETSPAKFKHVILTRFNVRIVEDPKAPSIGTDPGWLAERFALFERYCLPSILAQTEQNFSWIVYFDSATPEPYAERARALASRRPGIFPIFCETLPMSLEREIVRKVVSEQPQWLLTTRLDNDDGLHADFVATVQRAQRFGEAEVLNCPIGVILRGDRAYRRRDMSNAFISLSEPFADFQTVFSIIRHLNARDFYPVRQMARSPMWLQVIHANNISNRVRGWRIPRARAAPGFPPFGDSSKTRDRESTVSILTENLSLSLVRSFRDFAVTSLRRIAKKFGLDIRRKAPQLRKNTASAE